MTTLGNSYSGHAVVESLLIIPLLSLMLVGINAFGNSLSMLSAAESASHTEALRVARRQPSLASEWNRHFPTSEDKYRFDLSSGAGARILPTPFPSLSGRAKASVSLDREWDFWTRNALRIGNQQIEQKDELSGDCWENGSGSGRKIRNVVKVLVATGVL